MVIGSPSFSPGPHHLVGSSAGTAWRTAFLFSTVLALGATLLALRNPTCNCTGASPDGAQQAAEVVVLQSRSIGGLPVGGDGGGGGHQLWPRGLYLGGGIVFCYAQPLGLSMWLEGADKGITPHLCRGAGWEGDVSQVFRSLVRRDDYVLDVGANVGYYTLMLAQLVGGNGHVKAIEASPRTHDLVSTSVEFNGFSSYVEVINRAAFHKDDEVVHISTSRDRILNNHITLRGGKAAAAGTGKDDAAPPGMAAVKTLTIDSAVAGWPRLDFIKIDVEGAEGFAFKGMKGALAKFPNLVLVMEVNTDRMGKQSQAFYEEVSAAFPRMLRITGEGSNLAGVTVQQLMETHGRDEMLVLTNGDRVPK